jgi:hypothetical protein
MQAIITFVLSLALLMGGCRQGTWQTGDSASDPRTLGLRLVDFCTASGNSKPSAGNTAVLWNAARVQSEIKGLAESPEIQGNPWSAYPVVYQRMTAARDRERCTGVLKPTNPTDRAINDMLADLMTRSYVLQTKTCAMAKAPQTSDQGFCALMLRIKADNYDALSAAMASTAIYLSTNIALSLRAIIMTDQAWHQSQEAGTMDPNPALRLRARMEAMRRYKANFDTFNGFLADNLATVATALAEAKLVKGSALGFFSELAKYLHFKSCSFRKIRDQAFTTALEDSRELGGRQHPMLVPAGASFEVQYQDFQMKMPLTARGTALERFAIAAVAGPSQRLIYRHLLGGKLSKELEDAEDKDDSCPSP